MNISDFYQIFLNSSNTVIDSRKVQPGDIFFAFSGENFNAALAAEQAIESGALAAIVEDKNYENPDKNIFYTPSTLKFLQELAVHHREKLNIPIIGLTGSNGKTTTKELISAVLAEKYKVQFTQGNLNNHIGVPLTLLSVKAFHEIAVVEMGANHQKEIEFLCSIARPDYGYITNFGKAHLEGFGGFEGVIKGKSELYDFLLKNSKTVLVNAADPLQAEKTEKYPKTITFGTANSDYEFSPAEKDNFVGICYRDVCAISHLTGPYNFTNLCAAAALGLHFGIPFHKIKNAVENYKPTNMRSQVVEKKGRKLLLDTYNANPSSMEASLRNFADFKGTKAVILGDMLELGAESRREHQAILYLAKTLKFNEIITVGENFLEENSENAYRNTEQLAEHLRENPPQWENILLKGSRGIALEKLMDVLI